MFHNPKEVFKILFSVCVCMQVYASYMHLWRLVPRCLSLFLSCFVVVCFVFEVGCLSYCSVALKRHHAKGNLLIKIFNWGLAYSFNG